MLSYANCLLPVASYLMERLVLRNVQPFLKSHLQKYFSFLYKKISQWYCISTWKCSSRLITFQHNININQNHFTQSNKKFFIFLHSFPLPRLTLAVNISQDEKHTFPLSTGAAAEVLSTLKCLFCFTVYLHWCPYIAIYYSTLQNSA